MVAALGLLFAFLGAAQQTPTEWEARRRITELRKSLQEIEGSLAKATLDRWRNDGAPEAYLTQFAETKAQLSATDRALADLHGNPEKLSLAFEVTLRFEAMDHLLNSMREATRKFDDVAVADELAAKIGASLSPRDSFRIYLVELARDRDTQFAILLKEAQRCRTEVNVPPSPKKTVKPTPPTVPGASKP
jgi:hypothetical protein